MSLGEYLLSILIDQKKKRKAYSEADLRATVASAKSFAEVLRKLGISKWAMRSVHSDIIFYHLDISHFYNRGHTDPEKPWQPARIPTEQILNNEIKIKSHYLKLRLIQEGLKEDRCEVCGKTHHNGMKIDHELNHKNGVKTDNRIENIEIICPNCHSQTNNFAGKNKKPLRTKQEVEIAVRQSRTMTNVAALLSIESFRTIKRLIRIYEIDASNLTKLGEKQNHGLRKYVPVSTYLVYGSKIKSADLKARLFRDKIKQPICAECGIVDWNSKPLSFSLDHISGDKTDNRLENVRILCYICHSRTPTYKGRNIGKKNP